MGALMLLWALGCHPDVAIAPMDTGTAADTTTTTGTDSGTPPDTGPLPPVTLCVNEFMPANKSSVKDATDAFEDWIELHNFGDEAVSLDGWGVTDDRADPWKQTLSGDLAIEPGAFLLLWASGDTGRGPDHLPFQLSSDGGDVGLYAPDGRGAVVGYGTVADDFSIARVTDCCTGEGCFDFVFHGTPGISNVPVVTQTTTLLPAGSTWKYVDDGILPGQSWYAPGFDDSGWASGPGPLGYGDSHQVTVVSYGPDAAAKYPTTWFRSTFAVDDPSVLVSLTMGLLRDDGAVVYLNGEEVVRDNMPDGLVDATTLASESAGGADETAYWEFELDPALLVSGTNTVAVEVHQAALDSSDLGFDLRLEAEYVVSD